MSFPKHNAYKEAHASWVVEVPVTWEVARLGFEAETLVPMRDKPESLDGNIPWIRIEDFEGKYISISKSGQGVSEETIRSMNLKVFPVGTVLCSCSCSMGATAIAASQLVSNQTFIGIVPGQGYKPEYLYYLLQASSEHLNSIGTGAIQTYLSRDDFRRLRLPKPTLREQALVSNFLDRETAKIDALIAEQQRLIELLQEKRQAVISHAVTKGLNPNAPMKDSGVEWLGEVPEHWETKRLKDIADVIDCRNKTPDYVDDGPFLVVRTTNIKNRQLVLEDAKYTDEKNFNIWTQRGIPRPGSIFFTREAPTGETALVPEGIPLCMGQRMMNIDPKEETLTGFTLCFLQSACLSRYIEACSMGSTVAHLRVPQVENLFIPVPPVTEQSEIIKRVRQLDTTFDEAISALSSSAELLRERRSALISAAVTGQIDVRGLVPEAAEQ